MIDWITCKVRVERIPPFGRRIEISADGEIEVERDMPKHVESHETSVFVVPTDDQMLLISGNPTKWLQGHNVFGVDSWKVVIAFLTRLADVLDLGDWHIVTVTRLDITYSMLMDTEADVQAALAAIGVTTAERWGRPVVKLGSVYFGHPKRARLVCYSKAPEHRRHMSKHSDLRNIDLPPILRLELRLGRNWFVENSWKLCTKDKFRRQVWNKFIERIRVNDMDTLDISAMPRRCQKFYGLWVAGVDLAQIYSRPSLYRYAAEMRGYGIDIWAPYVPSNVVHLRRVLRSRPLQASDVERLGLPIYRVA